MLSQIRCLSFTNIEAAIGGKSSRKRFAVPGNTAARNINNGVTSLQLRCHCNPDHIKQMFIST